MTSAIQLAASVGTVLLVLCSGDSAVAEVADRLALRRRLRGLVVRVPGGYTLDTSAFETSDERFRRLSAGRRSDLSIKRNLGLVIARLLGWHKVMFLDDDMRGLSAGDVGRLAGALGETQLAAFRSVSYPDNSVVCHANRLSGEHQDVFASGSAMGVNCADQPLPFFPDVYNEDWFSFAGQLVSGDLPLVGESRQKEYDPYADPSRAAREEFGDVLAEGLFALIEDGGDLSTATRAYWADYLGRRAEFLDGVVARLDSSGADHYDPAAAYRAIRSVESARHQLADITAADCVDFIRAWRQDLVTWRNWTQGMNAVGSPVNALDLLGLAEWQATEFAVANRPKIPAPTR